MSNSAILNIPQVAPNQTNKETTINDATSILERSLNDTVDVDLTSADVTLNLTDFTRHGVFICAGHSVARLLKIPATRPRVFSVKNDGTGTVEVECDGAGGTTTTIDAALRGILFCDGTNVHLLATATQPGTAFYDIGYTFSDMPTDEEDQTFVTPRGLTIEVDGGDSEAYAATAPTVEAVFSIEKNGSEVGTITFALGANVGVFDIASPVTLVAGDRLTLVAPVTQDDSLADISVTLTCLR